MNELLSNLPVQNLNKGNDWFGTLPKGMAIKSFLESEQFFNSENKMIVLYGGWGTGKTSLMMYLKDNIEKTKYYPLFFETWKYEKDSNLALSLAELLASNVSDPKTKKEFWKIACKVLIGFVKGVSIKIPIPFLKEPPSFDFGKMIDGIKNAFQKKEQQKNSFSEDLKLFEKRFEDIEESILQQPLNDGINEQKIMILIDDLDRCEPENVLNLISAVKLFFTLGKKTVFLCGIDKNAISKAVETKYNDSIKADEYLEKVFDFSFNMPIIFETDKLLERDLGISNRKISLNDKEEKLSKLISDFFTAIHFQNPRHIKKVLNKYNLISNVKVSSAIGAQLVPDIIIDGKGSLYDTILTLFFIIIYEYYPDAYEDIRNFEAKVNHLSSAIYNMPEKVDHEFGNYFRRNYGEGSKIIGNIFNISMTIPHTENYKFLKGEPSKWSPALISPNYLPLARILIFGQFLPSKIEYLKISDFNYAKPFIDLFSNHEHQILYRFTYYLNEKFEELQRIDDYKGAQFSTDDLFKLMKTFM